MFGSLRDRVHRLFSAALSIVIGPDKEMVRLQSYLRDSDAIKKQHIAQELARLETDATGNAQMTSMLRSPDATIVALKHPDPSIRFLAIRLLKLRHTTVLPKLVVPILEEIVIADLDKSVRVLACWSLVHYTPSKYEYAGDRRRMQNYLASVCEKATEVAELRVAAYVLLSSIVESSEQFTNATTVGFSPNDFDWAFIESCRIEGADKGSIS